MWKGLQVLLNKRVNQKHGGFVSSFYGKFQKFFNENENDLKIREDSYKKRSKKTSIEDLKNMKDLSHAVVMVDVMDKYITLLN